MQLVSEVVICLFYFFDHRKPEMLNQRPRSRDRTNAVVEDDLGFCGGGLVFTKLTIAFEQHLDAFQITRDGPDLSGVKLAVASLDLAG